MQQRQEAPDTGLAAGEVRIHLGLEVFELEPSVAFYRVLFGTDPVKERPGYAKFEPATPRVNLSILETGRTRETTRDSPGVPGHFGLQVDSRAAVQRMAERLHLAGLSTEVQEGVDCCYALQDKVWVSDPDGHRWEIFVVLESDEAFPGAAPDLSPGASNVGCCVVDSSAVSGDTRSFCC